MVKRLLILLWLALLTCNAVMAEPKPVKTLTAKEQYALKLANEWKQNPDKPTRQSDGSVTFEYGASLPTIVCTPLHVCDIRLQPGEVLIKANLGDTTRWAYDTTVSGVSGSAAEMMTSHVIIKPTNSGLTTNMILSTDRRVYNIKLVSNKADWMPLVAFTYPDETKNGNGNVILASYQSKGLPPMAFQSLDFDYKLSGGLPSWRPVRVYSDGVKTYVQFPKSIHQEDVPVLVSLGIDEKEQLVNYRMQGDFFIVDKVLEEALLIMGHGRTQEKVKISRRGS